MRLCLYILRTYIPNWNYLIVNFSESRRHFVGDGTSDDDTVGLTRRRSENDSISIHVVTRSSDVHHLDGATVKKYSEDLNTGLVWYLNGQK